MPMQAATSVAGTFLNPIRHPEETATLLFSYDRSLTTTKKVTELFANTLKIAGHLCPLSVPNWSPLLAHCKFIGELEKTLKAEGTWTNLRNGKTFHPRGGFTVKYVTEQASITFATAAQVFQFTGAYVAPKLCQTVSVEFVAIVAQVATKTGSQSVVMIAKAVTDVGLGTLKNCSLIIFLSIQGWNAANAVYSGGFSVQEITSSKLACFENFGKVAILAMVVSGVGTPAVILAASFSVSLVGFANVVQKDLITKGRC